MTTLPIETNIETIPFEEITIGNYKNILQKKLDTILDSLVEARIITFEKIKQFQEKLKKKKTYKTLFLSIGNLVLKYYSDRDNVYGDKFSSQWKKPFIVNKVLNNDSYILQNQSGTIFNDCSVYDKNLLYGRQLELYSHLGEIIEDMKLMKKTTSEIQAEILGIIQLGVSRVLTIAKRVKTLIQKFGLLDTKLILS
ncbi:hypothetical protein G9A89_014667 [Geosiphon pyriformis]|nr:hypothetical protein G9A89_014667 [Geosiphon pyriformis]